MGDFRKFIVLIILIFLFILFVPKLISASVIINEVMYNPSQCSDNYCEWVELYNPHDYDINLSSCQLLGKDLTNSLIPANSYFLMLRNLGNFSFYFTEPENFLVNSFSLSNNGKEIVLEGNENCTDILDYTSHTNYADGNNYTLERREDGTWGESLNQGGTPGQENSIFSFSEDFSVLKITEICPDPSSADDDHKPDGEWVELFNSGDSPLDLASLFLTDQNFENELYIADNKVMSDTGTVIYPQEYKVIYRDGDSDFALNNNGFEEVILYENGAIIDRVTYSGSTEGMTWSLISEGSTNNWFLTLPTPGEENHYTIGCDWKLELGFENNIYQGEDLEFNISVVRLDGTAANLTVKGKIEDLFGETVKEYSPWTAKQITTSNQKDYSPNLAEGDYQITFWIDDISCEDYDLSNNLAHSLIAINPQYKETESSLNIEKIYLGSDDTAEWGDQFTVKVNIYKGEETKYAIELWAEKDDETVSKRSKLNIYEEYQNYTTTLPLQLVPNCNQKFEDGDVTLHLEGLGLDVTEKFEVEGIDYSVCKEYLDYIDELGLGSDSSESSSAYEIVNLPSSTTSGDVLEVTVQLIGDDELHEYSIWSYFYRGSKCYSCKDSTVEREYNLKEVKLLENELKQITFFLKLDSSMEEGDYKVKVKLNKDQQKTNKELTEEIYVFSEESLETDTTIDSPLQILSDDSGNGEASNSLAGKTNFWSKDLAKEYPGIIVYESSSEKARKLVPYILLVAFVVLSVIIFKKKSVF